MGTGADAIRAWRERRRCLSSSASSPSISSNRGVSSMTVGTTQGLVPGSLMHELSQTSELISSSENAVYSASLAISSVRFHYESATIVHRQYVETVRAIHAA